MTPAFDLAEHSPRLVRIAARFAGRKPGLPDVCLIRLSELDPGQPANAAPVRWLLKVPRRIERTRV